MDDYEILNYIAKHTYHVLDEYGRSAKIPVSLIKRKFEKKFPSWRTILKALKNKKMITSYIWNSPDNNPQEIRITTKGSDNGLDILFERDDHKRILIWHNNEPYLVDYKDWSNLDFFYDNEGKIVYEDELKRIQLILEIKKTEVKEHD